MKAEAEKDFAEVRWAKGRVKGAIHAWYLKRAFGALAAGAVVVALAGIAGTWWMARGDAAKLQRLVEAGEVEPLELVLGGAGELTEGPLWQVWYRRIRERMEPWKATRRDAEEWVAQARSDEAAFVTEIGQLRERLGQGLGEEDPEVTDRRVVQAGNSWEGLAVDLQKRRRPELDAVRQDWDRVLASEVAARTKEIELVVSDVEAALVRLRPAPAEIRLAESAEALAQARQGLARVMAWIEPTFARLRPGDEVRERFGQAAARAEETERLAEVLSAALGGLDEATDEATHRVALAGLGTMPEEAWELLPTGAKEDWKAVVAAGTGGKPFAALFGGDGGGTKRGVGMPVPESVSDEENQLRLQLLNDWKVAGIFVYQEKGAGGGRVYAKGRLEVLPRVMPRGTFYRAGRIPGTALWVTGEIDISGEAGESVESLRLRELELQKSVAGGLVLNYSESLLAVMDRLLRWKDVNPLFKAHVQLRLEEILGLRPEAWGLEQTSFSEDMDRLRAVEDEEGRALKLEPDSWMIPDMVRRWSAPLLAYYRTMEGVSYQKQMSTVKEALAALAEGGFTYVGQVDAGSRIRVAEPVGGGGEASGWWVLAEREGGKVVPLAVAVDAASVPTVAGGGGRARALRFSPVFAGSGVVEKLLEQAENDPVLARIFGTAASDS